jgi:hypothetical protein
MEDIHALSSDNKGLTNKHFDNKGLANKHFDNKGLATLFPAHWAAPGTWREP